MPSVTGAITCYTALRLLNSDLATSWATPLTVTESSWQSRIAMANIPASGTTWGLRLDLPGVSNATIDFPQGSRTIGWHIISSGLSEDHTQWWAQMDRGNRISKTIAPTSGSTFNIAATTNWDTTSAPITWAGVWSSNHNVAKTNQICSWVTDRYNIA